jgi:hypothetical protein
LVSDETEQMQRVCMVWLRRKDPPVKGLRVRQPPSLMVT